MISSAAAYAVICLFNSTEGVYVYAIPILIASFAYLNIRMVVLGNVVVIVSNIARILINWSDESRIQTAAFVSMFSLALIVYASIISTRLLRLVNEQNMSSIKAAAALQKESNEKMSLVAENIIKHFEEAMSWGSGKRLCCSSRRNSSVI